MNNKMAASKEAFDEAAKELTFAPGTYLDTELVLIEPFNSNGKQRCIVRMKGRLYLSEY